MKAKITVKHTETSVVELGDIPIALVRDILKARGDGTFDDNWTTSDLAHTEFTVTSIEVEEVESTR